MTDMIHRLLTVLMTVALTFTSSCVSTKDPVVQRQKSYEKLAALIQPGMTRRQLYALLPPKEVPRASPPSAFGGSPMNWYFHHIEEHMLDRDFMLDVEYKLASHRELRLYKNDMETRLKEINAARASLKRKLKDRYDQFFGRGFLIINVASRQNMDDEIVKSPQVVGPNGRQGGSTQLVKREEINVTPTDKSDEPESQLMKVLKHAIPFMDDRFSAFLNHGTLPVRGSGMLPGN